jgi:hypothetical protein
MLLKSVPEVAVKGLLAVVIIAFSAWSLRKSPLELRDDRMAGLFGFAAGVLGGAYGPQAFVPHCRDIFCRHVSPACGHLS